MFDLVTVGGRATKKKKCMQFRKSQETEVKVKEEIEAQRVRGRKGGRESWNVARKGRTRGGIGCLKGVYLVLIIHRDVFIHPTCFTFLSFAPV